MSSRRRLAFGSRDAFGDPGWDMLLFLLLMEDERRQVSVTDVIAGAGLSISTGVRWLQQLGELGLVNRDGDPKDRRRSFVSLTDEARKMLVVTLAQD